MRTHVIGLALLGICAALLAIDTRLYLSGLYREVLILTGAFMVVVIVLGVLIALVPSVRAAFTAD